MTRVVVGGYMGQNVLMDTLNTLGTDIGHRANTHTHRQNSNQYLKFQPKKKKMVEKIKWVEKFINWLLHDKSCCGWVSRSKCVDGHPEHPRNRYWTQGQGLKAQTRKSKKKKNANPVFR
jgi:hypothetical protein